MDRDNPSVTGSTFLLLLRDRSNPQAWERFVRRYAPKIHRWCCRWGLQSTDAEDVTQVLLAKLYDKIGSFHYDPNKSFRSWLKTLAHHAWVDLLKKQERAVQGSGDSQVQEKLEGIEAGDDFVRQLEPDFEREVLEEAMSRVQLLVEPKTWQAFTALSLEMRSGNEVAAELKMSRAAVFVAKNRIQNMLRKEVARLEAAAVP
jgi:RNA polymerase sigma-70 factor (ECF subfamily)